MTETVGSIEAQLAPWVVASLKGLDLTPLANAIVAANLAEAFPTLADDGAFVQALRGSVEENLAVIRQSLARGTDPEPLAPARPAALASLQAELDIPESEMQAANRLGIRTFLHETIAMLVSDGDQRGLSATELATAIGEYVERVLQVHDRVMRQVVAAHVRQRDLMRESQRHARQQLARQLLIEDLPLSEADAASMLHYEIGEQQIAVIASATAQADVAQVASSLLQATGASGWISLSISVDTVAIWLSHPEGWDAVRLARLRRALVVHGRVATIGDPAQGIPGFRRSLADAQRAERVRHTAGRELPDVLTFREVQLDTLLLSDTRARQRFLRTELGPLASDTKDSAKLRATLDAWLSSGSNVSAAAMLNLHEHTVRSHLRRAEELLGRPLAERRLELQTALRLCLADDG
jgi:DNA-binding PucR family transcriptional regulator